MSRTLLRTVVLSVLALVTLPVVAMPGMSPAANARPPSLAEPGAALASTALSPRLSSATGEGPGGRAWTQLAPDIRAKVDPRIWKERDGEVTPAYLGGQAGGGG